MLLSGEIARTAAHGLKGGVTAVIQGGKFEHGMYSAAFSSLGGSVVQPGNVTTAACIGAVLGGTAEEIGGGKFANGAVTGAFTVLFNDYLHSPAKEAGKGDPPKGQGGENFSLAGMYGHFQVGGGRDMHLNASSIDFSGTSQRQLGLTGMKPGDKRGVNLFKSGINSNSLAFGKVDMIYKGNNQFSILPNRFDFNIELQNGFTARNAGTVLGGAINYNLMISPAAALVPLIFGGPYDVYFNGTTYIPK